MGDTTTHDRLVRQLALGAHAAVIFVDYDRSLEARYPVTDASMDDGSYKMFANSPWLTKPAMAWFWNAYLPDASARKDIHVSPLNASIEQLRGPTKALVITAENDVLRDEGEAYARKLTEAGVSVTSRYISTIHDFVMLNALGDTPAAEGAIEQATEFLRNAFAR